MWREAFTHSKLRFQIKMAGQQHCSQAVLFSGKRSLPPWYVEGWTSLSYYGNGGFEVKHATALPMNRSQSRSMRF
jgi:hypothetical protein